MGKFVLILMLCLPVLVKAQVVSKEEWKQHMRSVLPTAFCQPQQYFRQCFRVTASECQETAYVATLSCLNEYDSKFPKQFRQPADGRKWGEEVGRCADIAYQTTLKVQNKKIDSAECNDISRWLK